MRSQILAPLLTAMAERRLRRPRSGRPHGLSRELIVSLTSYPARFETLHLTLACLLDQTVKADRTILWIAKQDRQSLPVTVLAFEGRGLEIRVCDDLRSYKKLIPALQAFPEASIATADDDLYYRRDWLENLVTGADEGVVPCHGVHRLKRGGNGPLLTYADRDSNVRDHWSRMPSDDLLPTTGTGALFRLRDFDGRVTERALFERLCPNSDDLWFYWCARMAGTKVRKVGGRVWPVNWPGSQASSLWESNETGGNDRAIAALQEEFGYLASG